MDESDPDPPDHRRRPPPGRRPLSPELIADLHARRQWLNEQARSSDPLIHEYLRAEWYDHEAQRWAAAKVGVETALVWREIGLEPAEAAALEQEGFAPEEVSRRWHGTGLPREEFADWIGAGLTPEEALAQRASGVTAQDAAVLRRLRNLGGR